MNAHAAALHREAIVWDTHGGFSPFADLDLSFLERWLESGATYLSVNVGYDHVIAWQNTIRAIAHFRRWIALHPQKFMLAETPADIARQARRQARDRVRSRGHGCARRQPRDDRLLLPARRAADAVRLQPQQRLRRRLP